jgi:hypothetical protein
MLISTSLPRGQEHTPSLSSAPSSSSCLLHCLHLCLLDADAWMFFGLLHARCDEITDGFVSESKSIVDVFKKACRGGGAAKPPSKTHAGEPPPGQGVACEHV